MRVLWINAGLHPQACHLAGLPSAVTSGWIHSQLDALRVGASSAEFLVLCLDYRSCDIQIGKVRYVSFGEKRQCSYRRIPGKISRKVESYIRGFNPDIIHVHGTEYFFSRFPDYVYCGKPVVVSIQGVISGCHIHYTGGLSSYEVAPYEWNLRRLIWHTTMQNEQTFWRETRVANEKESIQRHHYFMGRTEWDRTWIEMYNPDAIYYHVNETLRPPFYSGRRTDSQVIPFTIYASAAAGYPLKGGHFLLEAIHYLRKKYPQIKLLIAAASPRVSKDKSLWERLRDDYYAAYLRALIKRLKLEQNVELLPSLSAEEVAETLRSVSLFCLPSLVENSPNSLGEAMLMGVPCIATYVGGVPSVLKNGHEGVLCASSDVAALVSAVTWCFGHPSECSGFVENAYETAVERQNPSENARRTIEVYQDIIQRSGNKQ